MVEEVKALKGHHAKVTKIVGRQLATERFTELREAIVTRFLKRTPTQGGRVAWDFYPVVASRRRLRISCFAAHPLDVVREFLAESERSQK